MATEFGHPPWSLVKAMGPEAAQVVWELQQEVWHLRAQLEESRADTDRAVELLAGVVVKSKETQSAHMASVRESLAGIEARVRWLESGKRGSMLDGLVSLFSAGGEVSLTDGDGK